MVMLDEIQAAAGSGQLDELLLDPDFRGLLLSFGINWTADELIDASTLGEMVKTWRALLTGVAGYQPRVFRGAARLIQATDHPHELLANAESRWRAAVEGNLAVTHLPGDHFSMLEPPALDTLRDMITTYSSAQAPSY
jgi:thioesterase domain-containing protein